MCALRFAKIDKTKDQIESNGISHLRLILHQIKVNLDLNSIMRCHNPIRKIWLVLCQRNLSSVGLFAVFIAIVVCLFVVGTICNTLYNYLSLYLPFKCTFQLEYGLMISYMNLLHMYDIIESDFARDESTRVFS